MGATGPGLSTAHFLIRVRLVAHKRSCVCNVPNLVITYELLKSLPPAVNKSGHLWRPNIWKVGTKNVIKVWAMFWPATQWSLWEKQDPPPQWALWDKQDSLVWWAKVNMLALIPCHVWGGTRHSSSPALYHPCTEECWGQHQAVGVFFSSNYRQTDYGWGKADWSKVQRSNEWL